MLSGTVGVAGVDFTNKHGLWATNGALGGTSEILSTNAPGGGLNPTDYFTVFGSKVLFAGKDNSANNNLWVTDGTSAGTSELTVSGVHSGGIFFSADPATNPGFRLRRPVAAKCCSTASTAAAMPAFGRPTAPFPAPPSFPLPRGAHRSQPEQLLRIRQ